MKRMRMAMCLSLILMTALVVSAEAAKTGAARGLALCANALLPALFPFSVAVNLCLLTGAHRFSERLLARPLAKLGLSPAAAAAVLTGLLGGYPLGLHTLAALVRRGELPRRDAIAVSRFCNQAGPGFILGAAGLSLFGSARIGLLLWLVQILSCFAAALIPTAFSRANPVVADAHIGHPYSDQKSYGRCGHRPLRQDLSLSAALPEAIQRSASSMLTLCGCVVFFSTLVSLLQTLPFSLPAPLPALTAGALELTGGLFSLTPEPLVQSFVLCAALLAWGGFSVHFQGISALREAGLPVRPYLQGKALQSVFAALIALFFRIFL